MDSLVNRPYVILVLTFFSLWLAAWVGGRLGLRKNEQFEGLREDYAVVQSATLTLLGLIIGFSFSMATGRYDQRKNLEEAEANAIGTEYVRVDLLPAASAAKARALLKRYLDERILNYSTRDPDKLREIDARTTLLQAELWSAIQAPALANPTPVMVAVSRVEP